MTDPNTPLIRFRRYLVRKLEPHRDPGEGWCMNCSSAGGKATVISADGVADHARKHADSGENGQLAIMTTRRVT